MSEICFTQSGPLHLMITSQPAEWHDLQVEADMNELLSVRRVVLALLEKARGNK